MDEDGAVNPRPTGKQCAGRSFSAPKYGIAAAYVALRGGRVAGYYSLAAASAESDRSPARVAKGHARHGFQPSPTDSVHLYLLTKDMKKTLGIR